MEFDTLSDETLMQRVCARDTGAFRVLYCRYEARRFCPNCQAANCSASPEGEAKGSPSQEEIEGQVHYQAEIK